MMTGERARLMAWEHVTTMTGENVRMMTGTC
jgi:hypothetical protein